MLCPGGRRHIERNQIALLNLETPSDSVFADRMGSSIFDLGSTCERAYLIA